MRVLMVGGTEFIGRRVLSALVDRGDEVAVVHRGRTEPADLPACAHLHADRRDFARLAGRVAAFAPDAVVDTCAFTGPDADAVLPHLPDVPVVVLSSMDVYRLYELLLAGAGDPLPVPVDEDGPLRTGRYPYRGKGMDLDDYDKLDVEPAFLRRAGTVLRLGMVYGPHDPQRREEPILRRVRAGRARIPVGPGSLLATRLHVDDAARAVLAALERPGVAAGQVFNIGEAVTYPVDGWIRAILAAAGAGAELVRVPDAELPADLRLTRGSPHHLLVSSRKAVELLGWRPEDPASAVARSVRWHLQHPPADPDGGGGGFDADDAALASAVASDPN
jgi:nucleoside-diphosphate-sugar epimerase